MRPTGLNADQFRAYQAACDDGTQIRTRIDVLDRSRKFIRHVDGAASGEISWQKNAPITRTMRVTIPDPDYALGVDSSAPTGGFLLVKNLYRVTQRVLVPSIGWVNVPMGVFVPTEPSREGAEVTIAGEDKARLYCRPRQAGRLRKNTNLFSEIARVFNGYGETGMIIPSPTTHKTKTGPKDIPFGGPDPDRAFWIVARRELDKHGWELDFDALGRVWIHQPAKSSNPVDRWGLDQLCSAPTKSVDLRELSNLVILTGKTTGKGRNKKTARAREALPGYDDLSQRSLAVGGELFDAPAYLTRSSMTQSQLNKYAPTYLAKVSTQQVKAQLTVRPCWHADPGSWGRLEWRDVTAPIRMNEATIPLDGTAMTIGATRAYRRGLAWKSAL